MGRRQNSSDGSGATFFAVLIVVGLIVKFIWWILGVLALVATFYLVRAGVRAFRAKQAAYAAYCAQLAGRADQQHTWVLEGDARGTYGPEGVRLMRDIFAPKEIRPFGLPFGP